MPANMDIDLVLTVYADNTLRANVYNSMLNSDEAKPWSIPNFTCSTGNCTWDPIAALEMRAVCTNVTDQLNRTCGTTYLDLPSKPGPNCNISLPGARRTSFYASGIAGYLSDGLFPIGSMNASCNDGAYKIPCLYFIAPDGLLDGALDTSSLDLTSGFQAMKCSLRPVVHSFRAHVTNGSYHEDTLDVWTKYEYIATQRDDLVLFPPWGPENGMMKGQNFSISKEALYTMGTFIGDLFNGYASADGTGGLGIARGGASFGQSDVSLYATFDFVQAMISGNITGCDALDASKLRCAMENTAAAISKTFRDSTMQPGYLSYYPWAAASPKTHGQAMKSMTYIKIHWQWISSPLLVWLLGFISLIGTVWKSLEAGVPKWKSDPIPLLFLRENGYGSQSANDEAEDNLDVRLFKSETKFHLSVSRPNPG